MRKGGGKGKGSGYERWVARELSKWLTGGTDKTQLIRAVLSGGWKSRGKRQAGDLAANGPAGERFRAVTLVECKHHNLDLLWRLFTSEAEKSIQGWWEKARAEAEAAGLVPMLVFRQNLRPDMVALPIALATACAHLWGAPLLHYRCPTADDGVVEFGAIPFTALLALNVEQWYTQVRIYLEERQRVQGH